MEAFYVAVITGSEGIPLYAGDSKLDALSACYKYVNSISFYDTGKAIPKIYAFSEKGVFIGEIL